ncbi:MAG: fructosamine kinase family protein [Cyclobacteriaceae bacterium]|nr:fructosamine kinase family protein [Cyclobacteriaceae bacterium]MDW8330792.1 fructosamine kinase family protein [Cyclobacteriaceae bacterium]
MQLPAALKSATERQLQSSIIRFTAAAGGCINNGGEIKLSNGTSYFIKWNNAEKFPGMFLAERHGLELLKATNTVRVPQVFQTFQDESWQVIVMEFVRSVSPAKQYWENLGHQLAALHRHTASYFGLASNNYIGSLHQINQPESNWTTFFITHRLEAQLSLAEKFNRVDSTFRRRFEKLYTRLPEIFPNEPPSLLHGDLWSGNLITDEKGQPCLIDPAVYYGHREAELAFTKLFGGFDTRFYEAYQKSFPLQPGFSQRVDIYNLYPLMVHVNLFGGSYLASVKHILSRYGC